MESITTHQRQSLLTISTATIATCLFKKGLRNQYLHNVQPLRKGKPNMVGPAFTLRYIPAREDLNPISVFKDKNHPQRVAVERCPKGAVLVMDSRNDPRAASAGSILIKRLMIREVAGVVTDGGFRDSSEIATFNFPAFHQRPSAPTNLTLHQAIDLNVPIACGGVAIFPGDILVGDDDGVMVIPQGLLQDVIKECLEMTEFENFVMEQVDLGEAVIGLYPPTDEKVQRAFVNWKEQQRL